VHFAAGNPDKRGDITAQVQQRVHLHRAFVLSKPRIRKQGETEIDCGRIERIEAAGQIDAIIAALLPLHPRGLSGVR
jgi:hypothetical protein